MAETNRPSSGRFGEFMSTPKEVRDNKGFTLDGGFEIQTTDAPPSGGTPVVEAPPADTSGTGNGS